MTTAFERLLADPKMQWKDFPLEDIPPVHDYEHALRMFAPSTSPRYQPRAGLTFCNIFISDVTRALAKHWLAEELPHRVDGAEQTMNMMIARLRIQHGASRWVRRATPIGQPVVRPTLVTWRSKKGSGHGAFVCPSDEPTPDDIADIRLAQAGQKCGIWLPLRECFGRKKWPELEWWVAS
jgi:hypothetical protein